MPELEMATFNYVLHDVKTFPLATSPQSNTKALKGNRLTREIRQGGVQCSLLGKPLSVYSGLGKWAPLRQPRHIISYKCMYSGEHNRKREP